MSTVESLYRAIQENSAENTPLVSGEVYRYLEEHQDEVVQAFRAGREPVIPTSIGLIRITLADLQAAAA